MESTGEYSAILELEAPKKARSILRKGDFVTAITGVYLVAQPSQIRITMPIPEYGLVPGDSVLGYLYLGEGFYKAWSKGHWIEEFDGTGIVSPDRLGCKTRCNATYACNDSKSATTLAASGPPLRECAISGIP